MAHSQHLSTDVYLPLLDVRLDLGPAYYLLLFLVVAGGANAVNLTDGLDGLAAGTATIAMLTYTAMMVVAFLSPGGLTAEGAASRIDLAILGAAIVGGCVGFLWYNAYPADVFMGDTGSFGLGGALAAMAVFTKTEFLLVIIGGVFVLEALSVAIQVIGFKVVPQARVPDGADPPPLRDAGVDREQDHRAVLDPGLDLRRQRLRPLLPGLLQVPVSGGRYVVLGLRRSGLAAGEAIRRDEPGAEVVGVRRRRGRRHGEASGDGRRIPPRWRAGVDDRGDSTGEVARCAGRPPPGRGRPRRRRPGLERGRAGLPAAPRAAIIGITGTNGKTTTTELVGAMLRAGNVPVEVAGNVGRPLCDLAGRVDPATWIACELSSFQLEDIDSFRARVGVVLQVTPDHLDRHGTFAEYLRSKLRLFENQTAEDTAVLNADDPVLREAEIPGAGRRVWFSREQSDRIDWEHSSIRGDHNLENALAASAAAEAVGVSREARDRALRSFTPPPHRLQTVAVRDGVSFVDDSKATNPEAVIKALTAYQDGVRLVLGGSLKGSSFAELAAAVAAGPVVSVDVYGEAGEQIAAALAAAGVPHRRHPRMAAAVAAAAAGAQRRRRGAAVAGMRQLRRVHGLRRARPGIRAAGAGGAGWSLTSSGCGAVPPAPLRSSSTTCCCW